MKLTLLDTAGIVDETVELARLADSLGYTRFWIAEHQPQPAPTLITGIVAGITSNLRVGTAGVLLHYLSPWRTAHDFHFLERAYTGRIDAGFCGGFAPTTPSEELEGRDPSTFHAAYPDKVARLVRHLRNTPGDPAYDPSLAWSGALDDPPEIWSLGSGRRGAELAMRHGLYFGYALMYVNSADDPAHVERYREGFVAYRTQPAPKVGVAVCVACADTDAAAQAATAPLPQTFFKPRFVGEPARVADGLHALAERYHADELILADRCDELPARARCYELLAKALA